MRKITYLLGGFLGFLFITTLTAITSILLYETVIELPTPIILIIIIGFILVITLLCLLFDFIRRRIMINRPLNEILHATKKMAKGNFDINLIPHHEYKNYDEFDLIKLDLNRLAEELSKSEILKNDFIANISHEMKTPLAIIMTYAKTLSNDDLTEAEKAEYIKSLKETCVRLNNLVTNILKLNKLENNKLQLDISRFNISDLLANQILEFEQMMDTKNINLECDIEDDLYICSEKSYLEIIFSNLISNAIKFSNNEGTIKISLHLINEYYVITIEDNGCGMDKYTGAHIFDKFYQGETSHSKEGNGLGLALVKKVIDSIGGTIEVSSELNVGTTFIISIRSEENE